MGLKPVVDFFADLRLTVVCLALGMVLVFFGTMAQEPLGLYLAQHAFFQSLFVDAASFWAAIKKTLQLLHIELTPSTVADVIHARYIPVFPGGYLVGGTLVISLACSFVRRIGFKKQKIGLLFVHLGLILLLLGQFTTDLLSVESSMRLAENESKNYSESSRYNELAIADTTDPQTDDVVAIPENLLARRREITDSRLPFTVRVVQYWRNSAPAQPGELKTASPATQGVGRNQRFTEEPVETRMDRRDVPTAYIELVAPTGSLGTWAVSGWVEAPQSLSFNGRTYALSLRQVRYYKPFSLQLLKFSHDKYSGTDIPKNFSSRVRLQRPDTGEDRELLIYMNNPLRYGGETFYQSGYDERNPQVPATILQVVHNPGWLTPYFACLLVPIGLVVHFLTHLTRFVRKRVPAPARPVRAG